MNHLRTVTDDGQHAIKGSKGYDLKARLCMLGDREKDKDSVRADSPTAHKLALAVAVNEQFDFC